MKRNTVAFLFSVILFASTVGCRTYRVDPVVEIKTNETAFLVPLEGEANVQQGRFMSEEYLQQAKVATKRITIPQRQRDIGRSYWDIEWIPTMRVVVVDRTPVTREWTKAGTGTSPSDQAIAVESKDSINFKVGVNCTAVILEEDAAKFLYFYAGAPLSQVMDQNVRGFAQSVLSREFGERDLGKARGSKKEIFDKLTQETTEHFKKFGVTITNLGLSEGLTYDNPAIQQAIDDAFKAEMAVATAEQHRLEAEKVNQAAVAKAIADARAAQEFAKSGSAQYKKMEMEIRKLEAEAKMEYAKHSQGAVPQILILGDSKAGGGQLFGLGQGLLSNTLASGNKK